MIIQKPGKQDRWVSLCVSLTIHIVLGLLIWRVWDWTPNQVREIPVELALNMNPVRTSVEKTNDFQVQDETVPENTNNSKQGKKSLQTSEPVKPETIDSAPRNQTEAPKMTEQLPKPQVPAGLSGHEGEGGNVLLPPKLLNKPELVVPKELVRDGFSGSVLLTVEVLENGRVGKVVLNRSGGSAAFDALARENVAKWEFEPARQPQGGKPVKVMTSVWVIYDAKARG